MDIVFALAPLLHSFWSYFSTDLSSNLGAYQPGEFLFQYPIILPFHTVHGVLKARILKWFALEMNRDHSIGFEIASKYFISDSFVDHDGYSISSEVFLPAVVYIMVI